MVITVEGFYCVDTVKVDSFLDRLSIGFIIFFYNGGCHEFCVWALHVANVVGFASVGHRVGQAFPKV